MKETHLPNDELEKFEKKLLKKLKTPDFTVSIFPNTIFWFRFQERTRWYVNCTSSMNTWKICHRALGPCLSLFGSTDSISL